MSSRAEDGGGALCETLVLAAHPMEVAPLSAWLGGPEAPPGLADDVAVAVTGVGLGEAGAGAALALARHRPRRVVLVGSAGAYGSARLPLGSLVLGRDVHLVAHEVVAGRAALPEAMQRVPMADAPLSDAIAGAAPVAGRVAVATTLGITTDDAVAASLDAAGPWEVENLEAFAVAHACEHLGVPFAVLLAITNQVGSQGREQWRAHHQVAAEQTQRALSRWLGP